MKFNMLNHKTSFFPVKCHYIINMDLKKSKRYFDLSKIFKSEIPTKVIKTTDYTYHISFI